MDGKGTTELAWTGRALSVRPRKSTRDDEQACDSARHAKRRRDHCSPGDVQNTRAGDGKRVRSCGNGGASSSIVCCSHRQLHCSDEETQSLLFSPNPRAVGSGNVQDPSGSKVNVQQFMSSFEIDPIKHKVFLSHAGAQKNFVEQLCVDLEARGYLFPFFDQRHHSLPKGKDFVPLIKRAARLCHVVVIVLSEEFLTSKWPMIELVEFYSAKQGGNNRMTMLPLFYKLSIGDLDDWSIEDRWMPKWNELASQDRRIDVTQWAKAVKALQGVNGLPFGQFMGRVCHVELGAMTRMKRQELMLKTLCGIERDVLDRLTDDRKGLKLMRDCMKWEPVFLVMDNVTNDESSRKEAHEYLTVGFHPKSKIMITARSKEVLQDLLLGVRFCMSIPKLNEEEARRIFLRSAAPMKCFSSLMDVERTILGRCIQKCLLGTDNYEFLGKVENRDNSILNGFPRYGAYHPLALSAMGDFFYRLSTNTEMLRWKDSLEENNELMRDVLQSRSITSIIGLQFSSFSSSEQLLFLDIALLSNSFVNGRSQHLVFDKGFDFWVEWLSALHGETASVIKRRV